MLVDVRTEASATLARYERLFPKQPELLVLKEQLGDPEDCFARSNMRGHITTSAAVLSPDLKRMLMVHHIHHQRWLPPGGHYERPGGLWESAMREVAEETGIRKLRLHQWCEQNGVPVGIWPHPVTARPSKGEVAHLHHDFRYLAIAEKEELFPQLEEVHAVRWVPLLELMHAEHDDTRRLVRRIMAIR